MSDQDVARAVRQRGQDIAYRIRAELVCCNLFERVQSGELTIGQAKATPEWHDLCYWGEASARLAEGRCPGYETTPNVCECPCVGCESNCNAHVQAEESR